MNITSLDELIEKLVRSRTAAGKNVPVRIKIEVHSPDDDQAPPAGFVSIEGVRVMPCISDDGEFVQIQAVGSELV